MQVLLGVLIVAGAIALLARRAEVRLVLLGAGFLMAALAGQPMVIPDTFARAMVAGVVAPICTAMGFAAVLSATGCDRHLVALLTAPLRRAGPLLLPGSVLAAYLVNLAVPSQSSTAAALGPVLLPLLRGAGFSPLVAAATLVLGASFGGDLLNPGAQDIQAIAGTTPGIDALAVHARILPASLAGVVVAALAMQIFHGHERSADAHHAEPLQLDPLRAFVPLLPVTLLLLGHAGTPGLGWLLTASEGTVGAGLPVVTAMLIGVVAAGALSWRELRAVSKSFFEGMGAAYASVISLTIAAQCFGAGLKAIGLAQQMLELVGDNHSLALFLALCFPWALSFLSGSGSGPILTFAQTLLVKLDPSHNPPLLAALACFGGAFGRTTSPVSAVVIYTAGLAEVEPLKLVRCLARPLLAGALVSVVVAVARG